MTTKTVAVQLVALTQQYQAAMGKATASTIKLQTASSSAGKSIGSVMGPQIAIAGAVVAGAAVKMAYDWENAFTKIAAITDTSQAQVGQWKEQVLGLAGETARSPQELADALYFLASAGLDASEIMPTLEMSAKAAASGLGETGDIARLTANAINAYSKSGLTAAQVTDTLVAAVREGTAEPTEFADAMGRILPIASKAGITFDQVAASLAGLSNIGLDVNEGVTAMRGLLVALEAPGTQAAKTLASIGLSANEVRRSLAEDGLIATLRMLETQTGGNIDTLRKIVPNVRALTGVFGLTGQEAAKVDEIFQDVQDSTGDLGRSFAKTAESPGHKLRQALVDIQVELIKLGDAALPAVATGLGVIAQGAENARIKLEGLGHAYTEFSRLLGAAIIPSEQFRQTQVALREALISGNLTIEQTSDLVHRFGDDGVYSADRIEQLELLIASMKDKMTQGSSEADRYGEKIVGTGKAAAGAEGPIEDLGGKVKDTADQLENAEKRADKFSDSLDRLTKVAFDVEDASLGWHQALIDLNEELKEGIETLDINTQEGIDNREAFRDAAEAALKHGIAARESGKSVEKATGIVRDHIAQLRQEALDAGFTKEEIDDYIRVLNLTPKQIRTLIEARGVKAARTAVSAFIGDLNRIPDIKDVLIRVRSTGYGTGQQVGHAGGVVGNLPRYHGGGEIKSDEQLVLARKGETIRTVAQERALMSTRGTVSHGATKVVVVNRIYPKLDRRRYTEQTDHDATYDGRW